MQVDPTTADPDRTITGRAQLDWLKDSLTRQVSQWKLVGNPVMITPVTFAGVPAELVKPVNDTTHLIPTDGEPYNVDQWDGYTDDRRELFAHLRDNGVTDTVFVTGDIHSGWACRPACGQDHLRDHSQLRRRGVRRHLGHLEQPLRHHRHSSAHHEHRRGGGLKANNPHIKYIDFDDHGFSVLDITAKRAQMDWFVIGDRADKNAGVSWTPVVGDHGRQPGHPLRRQAGGVSMNGNPNPALNRRTFLKVTGVGGAALAFSSAPRAAYAAATTKRAYVVVIDGCRPGEVDAMPNVAALRDAGTWYPAARSLPVMETIPNHVMMMTGCRPARNGVPANSIYDRTTKAVRDCSQPTDIRVQTVIEQLNASGRTTGTVLSKEYLYSVFGTRATHRWEPFPLLPITEHAPDAPPWMRL